MIIAMFLTVIVTLTAATVDGFPQLAAFNYPHYQRQYLPAVAVSPMRSFNYYGRNSHTQSVVVHGLNPRGYQSENFAVPPAYRVDAENARVIVKPRLIPNSANFAISPPYRDYAENARVIVKPRLIPNSDNFAIPPAYRDYADNARVIVKPRLIPNSANFAIPPAYRDYSENARVIVKPHPSTNSAFSSNEFVNQFGTGMYNSRDFYSGRRSNLHARSEIESNETSSIYTPAIENNDISTNYMTLEELSSSDPVAVPKIFSNEDVQQVDAVRYQNKYLNTGESDDRTVYNDTENSMEALADSNALEKSESNAFVSRSGLSSSGNTEKEDKWIWSATDTGIVETTTPDIVNRVLFDGDSCPSGMVRIHGKCVIIDE